MNEIWTFSTSSQELLQRCLAAADPADENAKWVKKFKSKNHNVIGINDSPTNKEIDIDSPILSTEEVQNELSTKEEQFLEVISEGVTDFDEILDKCKTNIFIEALAKKLPVPSVEKFLEHILNIENIDNGTFIKILTIFYPESLRRHYSRYCFSFMKKIRKKHPNHYKIMLNSVIKDINIPQNVVNDYILSLTEGGKTEFMNYLINIEFTSEMFVHHLCSILTIYKECCKSDAIQNFISKCLIQHVEACKNKREYGALFLEYLQKERDFNRNVNVKSLIKALEIHESPFKRACLVILKDIDE